MAIKDPKKLLQQVLLLASLPFVLLLLMVWRNISLKNAVEAPVTASGTESSGGILWSGSSSDAQQAGIDSNAENVSATDGEKDATSEDTPADEHIQPIEKTTKKQVSADNADTSSSSDASLDDIVSSPNESASTTNSDEWNSSSSGSSAYKVGKGKTSYYHKALGFGFDVPVAYYYANFGGQGGSALQVGLKKGSSPESADSADVVVSYFPDTLASGLSADKKSAYDKDSDTYYAKLGKGSVAIKGYSLDKALSDSIVSSLTVGSN